jgi:very-short-patch-repair endonuclease
VQEALEKYNSLVNEHNLGNVESTYTLSKLVREQAKDYNQAVKNFPDVKTGIQLLEIAANRGIAIAQFEYGVILLEEKSGNRDDLLLSLKYLRNAHEAGIENAYIHIRLLENKISELNDLESISVYFGLPDASEAKNYKSIFDLCDTESPPELLFIKTIVRECGLIPSGKKFISKISTNTVIMSIEPQFCILNYRADFIINKKYVVEIDGRKYHEHRFNEDRYRDQEMMAQGFIVIRFTASQVLSNPVATVNSLKDIVKNQRQKK